MKTFLATAVVTFVMILATVGLLRVVELALRHIIHP